MLKPTSPRCLAALAGVVLAVSSLSAQQDWRWANPLPASVGWKGAAHGNGLYVIVGQDATIATSTDGATWALRRMSTAQMALNAISFANGRFVAVGLGTPAASGQALIMTSTDGSNWSINETIASTVNAQFADVVFGNGTWLVSGAGGNRLFASTDGLNWAQRSTPTLFLNGAHGNGVFVFTNGNNTVSYSSDGTNWTRVPVAGALGASTPFINDVAFGGGRFVAVGRDNNFNAVAYTSTDGASWTAAPAIPNGSNGLEHISASGSNFVAAGNAGVFSSPDGTTWTRRTSALPASIRSLGSQAQNPFATAAASNLLFVLGGYGSITTSTDGAAWTLRTTGTVNDLSGLVHDGARFVVTGAGGTVLTSPDGLAWTTVASGTSSHLGRLAYNGTRYVTADFSGILHSTTLTAWTSVPGTTADRFAGVVHGNNRFVAAHTATLLGTRTSADGVTWTGPHPIANSGGNTNGLAFGNGVFVLVMGGFGTTPSKIYSSTDGAAWIDRTPAGLPAGTGVDSLAFGNGRFVALTGNQRSLTSADGVNWTIHSLPATPRLSSVFFVGPQFVARGEVYGAPSHASADGITWTLLENSLAPNTVLTGMLAHGNTVVAIGSTGTILRGDLATISAPPAPANPGRLINMAIRSNAGTGDSTLIVGVAFGGAGTSGNKAVLIRGVGPTLGAFGVGGALADPVMTVFQGSTPIASNDDWAGGFDFTSVGAFAFAGTPARDAALYNAATPPGSYSIQITGKNNATGIALAEIYDATPAANFSATTPRLVNVSARTEAGAGDNILIAGFVIGGATPVRVLIRAAGPTLAGFGVGGTLADPKLEIFNGSTKTAENDNWAGTTELKAAFQSVGAFAFAADNSRDAALVATLQPGNYTAQISGVGGTTGIALVEVYELP